MPTAARDFFFSCFRIRPTPSATARIHRFRSSIAALSLFVVVPAMAQWSEEGEADLTTLAQPDGASAPADVLHDYAQRAAELRYIAVAEGFVNYAQVIASAYAPGAVNDETLAAKAQWRAAAPAGFEFFSDYGLVTVSAAVQDLTPVSDAGLRSTLVAQYEATSHVIGLSAGAPDFTIFHESGHALQRAALSARGLPAGRRTREPESLLDRVLRAVAADTTSARRLKYLCSQDEFEVRLQDLNRFHALLLAGRPIMTPADSIRALSALGMPLEYEEVREAFLIVDQDLPRKWFDEHVAALPAPAPAIDATFEDARELLRIRSLALRVDHSFWQRMLAKMIFEAPGHL
jgi:hypothetical protein